MGKGEEETNRGIWIKGGRDTENNDEGRETQENRNKGGKTHSRGNNEIGKEEIIRKGEKEHWKIRMKRRESEERKRGIKVKGRERVE